MPATFDFIEDPAPSATKFDFQPDAEQGPNVGERIGKALSTEGLPPPIQRISAPGSWQEPSIEVAPGWVTPPWVPAAKLLGYPKVAEAGEAMSEESAKAISGLTSPLNLGLVAATKAYPPLGVAIAASMVPQIYEGGKQAYKGMTMGDIPEIVRGGTKAAIGTAGAVLGTLPLVAKLLPRTAAEAAKEAPPVTHREATPVEAPKAPEPRPVVEPKPELEEPVVVGYETAEGVVPGKAVVKGEAIPPALTPNEQAEARADLAAELGEEPQAPVAPEPAPAPETPPVSAPEAKAPEPTPPAKVEAPAAKEPWQMPLGEFVDSPFNKPKGQWVPPPGYHRALVEKAIREGKPVPPEVLADYPDLAPKPAAKPAAETGKEMGDEIAIREADEFQSKAAVAAERATQEWGKHVEDVVNPLKSKIRKINSEVQQMAYDAKRTTPEVKGKRHLTKKAFLEQYGVKSMDEANALYKQKNAEWETLEKQLEEAESKRKELEAVKERRGKEWSSAATRAGELRRKIYPKVREGDVGKPPETPPTGPGMAVQPTTPEARLSQSLQSVPKQKPPPQGPAPQPMGITPFPGLVTGLQKVAQSAQRVWREIADVPKFAPFKRVINKFHGDTNRTSLKIRQMQADIESRVPDPKRFAVRQGASPSGNLGRSEERGRRVVLPTEASYMA